jgi:hypothetical protein
MKGVAKVVVVGRLVRLAREVVEDVPRGFWLCGPGGRNIDFAEKVNRRGRLVFREYLARLRLYLKMLGVPDPGTSRGKLAPIEAMRIRRCDLLSSLVAPASFDGTPLGLAWVNPAS